MEKQMKSALAPATCLPALALLLSGCVETEQQIEPEPTETPSETATPTPEPEKEEPEDDEEEEEEEEALDASEGDPLDYGEVGDTVTNHGAELTLNDAYMAETIPWNESAQPPGNPLYEITPRPAEDGAKWFVMETTVSNEGRSSMDLTCSWPIEVVGVDVDEREFDTINSLYQYEANPACNDSLQPGFSAEMTYVFSIPSDAEMLGVAFRDTEEAGWEEYSVFVFEEPWG